MYPGTVPFRHFLTFRHESAATSKCNRYSSATPRVEMMGLVPFLATDVIPSTFLEEMQEIPGDVTFCVMRFYQLNISSLVVTLSCSFMI